MPVRHSIGLPDGIGRLACRAVGRVFALHMHGGALFSFPNTNDAWKLAMEDIRLGFVGVVVEDRSQAESVNKILSGFGGIIRGRIGIPDQESGEAVIGLIVKGSNDDLGALTGKLGNLSGVQVKSALTASKK